MKWNSRTELLLGSKNIEKLNNSHVLIAGLGGVGGYAAEQLARAGVGVLTIIDSDKIDISNLNRQLIALQSNIGEFKVFEFEKRLKDINPDIQVNVVKEFIRDEKLKNVLLQAKYDFVIDAIDTLSPKLNFIKTCVENNIPLVSSMGAGGKTNPLKVTVADISKTYNCTLARILRKRLHRIGIRSGFKAVFSHEKTDKDAVVLEEGQNKKSNVGTISYMPALFGIHCAGVVLRGLIKD